MMLPRIHELMAPIATILDAARREQWHIDPVDGLPVRLHVRTDGSWSLHVGNPSYDQDHRGQWGTSSLDLDSDPATVAGILLSGVERWIPQSL